MTRYFAALAALCLNLAAPAQAGGESAPPAPTPPSAVEMARYAEPARRVDIGGRAINLICIGNGPRTLLFEAGGSDWSIIWALVQPRMGDGYRACAYDRAGMGFSDPSPWPRTPIAIVEDMHAMVTAAALPKPLILIGHSLGGFNAKLYAALYPEDVAALILVDPSEENADARGGAYLRQILGERAAVRSELMDASFRIWLMDRYRHCAAASMTGPMDAASAIYRRCTDPARPILGDAAARIRQNIQITPAYQQAQASEILNSIYGDNSDNALYARLFQPNMLGSRPLIVLTHGDFDADDSADRADHLVMTALHQETARLSQRGQQQQVEHAGHNIELDRPDAVIAAIRAADAMLRADEAHR